MATREDLVQLAMEEFEFLQVIDGCEREVIEVNTLLTTLAYKFPTIAVELHFDWRDLFAMCYISMPSEGRLPDGYLLQDGRRIRYRLGDLTPEVLAKLRQLPRPPKRRPPPDEWARHQFERMEHSIRIYAEAFRANFVGLRAKAEAGFYPDGS